MSFSVRWTVAELEALPEPADGTRYEIIDGELYVSRAPSPEHQYTCMQLGTALVNWTRASGHGLATLGPGMIFADDSAVIPDLLWGSRQRFREILRLKIRPHPFGEVEFGVGAFPQQEVGQPLLAAGPDDEVHVAKFGFACDKLRKCLSGEIADTCGLRGGLQDRIAGRVIDGDAQMQDIVTRSSGLRAPDRIGEAVGETIAASYHAEANTVADKAFDLVGQIEAQQRHQRGDFSLRSPPIVA